MTGLLTKIYMEVRWPVLWFSLGLCFIMGLLTALLPKVLGDIQQIFERMPFIKPLLTALLGVDPGEQVKATMSQAFLWVHPTVLTLLWAHEVMYCTRLPAGEIDRGTIDFLLGLPVSRWKLFIAETIGWLTSGVVILGLGYAGHLLASMFLQPGMRPPAVVTLFVMCNLLAVYLAVGGFAFLISSVSDRRGRAIGVVFAVLLFTFLINFVAQFWDPLKSISTNDSSVANVVAGAGENSDAATADSASGIAMLSVMDYYRPAIIIQSGAFPWSDVAVLLFFAAFSWTIAGVCLSRRSICTV
ncbi:MAG: ABC transporter permease subunit [Planctomycetaceae bacterium]|nr:ABC transporter permease subunit [Planctomycetaceae bacterium]